MFQTYMSICITGCIFTLCYITDISCKMLWRGNRKSISIIRGMDSKILILNITTNFFFRRIIPTCCICNKLLQLAITVYYHTQAIHYSCLYTMQRLWYLTTVKGCCYLCIYLLEHDIIVSNMGICPDKANTARRVSTWTPIKPNLKCLFFYITY